MSMSWMRGNGLGPRSACRRGLETLEGRPCTETYAQAQERIFRSGEPEGRGGGWTVDSRRRQTSARGSYSCSVLWSRVSRKICGRGRVRRDIPR